MNNHWWLSSALIGALMCASPAVLAEDEQERELDVIMNVVDEDESPDDVVGRITLPAPTTGADTRIDARGGVDPQELARVKGLVQELLQDTDSTLNNAINDALSSGDIERLPQVIKDNLPEGLVDELDSDVDELTDQLVDDLPLQGP